MSDTPTSYQLIYATVRQIPKGRVATYGQIAELAGLPRQARLVGYAMHALPARTTVPWHRVVNAQGRISLPLEVGSGALQQKKLEKEGVKFSASGAIDLKRYRWEP